ncbi:UNVERIFIED_CONTAM: hypothetical protein FKN15_051146 [Acipenser sinensis]
MNQLDRPKQRNQHVYQQVVDALSRRGIERTVPQARDKFKKLKQSYLQERARRCRSGEAGQSRFRFWEEMNSLLGRRPVAAAHLTGTSQHAAPEASSSCLDRGTILYIQQSSCNLQSRYLKRIVIPVCFEDPSASVTTASQSAATASSSPRPQAEELSKRSDSDAMRVERQEEAELVDETPHPQPDVPAREHERETERQTDRQGTATGHETQHSQDSTGHKTQHSQDSTGHATQHSQDSTGHKTQHSQDSTGHKTQHSQDSTGHKTQHSQDSTGPKTQHSQDSTGHKTQHSQDSTGHKTQHSQDSTGHETQHSQDSTGHKTHCPRDSTLNASGHSSQNTA